MNPAQTFAFCNLAVLPGWLLLIVLPRWRWTRIVAAYAIPAGLGLVYLLLMIQNFDLDDGGFGSLDQVARLFENPWLLLAGWIHYLAFDLFIGAWEVRDAQRLGIHHLLVVPCLVLTFMLGPVGLLLYLILRGAIKKRLWLDEAPASAHHRT